MQWKWCGRDVRFPRRARASGAGFRSFARGRAAGTLRWARGQEGRFDAPLSSSGLHSPLTKKGLLAPFRPQRGRAPYKKASASLHAFLCSADWKPPPGALLSHCDFKSEKRKNVQQRRPPPAADTGRSCWGRGQQDTSAVRGTKWTLGTATRLSGAASIFSFRPPLWGH